MCLFLILDLTQVKACKCHAQVYIRLVLSCAVSLSVHIWRSAPCSNVLVSVTSVLESQSAVTLDDLLYLALT